mmetsp:Transcript_13024/g.17931  ORF Transcript_13024/g.17931 Transcript_13024/m.17931 type:complete len:126 (-) Transcript_13024:532-909(-)
MDSEFWVAVGNGAVWLCKPTVGGPCEMSDEADTVRCMVDVGASVKGSTGFVIGETVSLLFFGGRVESWEYFPSDATTLLDESVVFKHFADFGRRDFWHTIFRHNSGSSRRKRSWWKAPASGPRDI